MKYQIPHEKMIPPQNIEAEQCVLGSVLAGKTGIHSLPNPDFFYRDAHKHIAAAMIEAHRDSSTGEIDIIVVVNILNDKGELDKVGGPAYVAQLLDEAPIVFNSRHSKIIEEKAILRKVIQFSSEVAAMAYQEQDDVDSIIAKWQRELNETFSMFESKSTNSLSIGFDDLMDHFSARKTHLGCLNDATGGLHGGDVIIVGGRPSMGKTSLCMGFIDQTAIKDNETVVYFGPEVTPEKLYSRLLSSKCKIGIRRLKGRDFSKEEEKKLIEAHREINKAPIRTLATNGKISAVDIAIQSKALAEGLENKIGLIIIENLQQITWPEKLGSDRERMNAIFACLKSLAMELNVPIVISSQIKREVDEREDKRPLPSDLKQSGEIEELADLIILLYREGYYYPDKVKKNEKGSAPAEMGIFKGGPTAILLPDFNDNFLAWLDA